MYHFYFSGKMIRELIPCQDNKKSIRKILRKYSDVNGEIKYWPFSELQQTMVVKLVLNWIEKKSKTGEDYDIRIIEDGSPKVYDVRIANRRGTFFVRRVEANYDFGGRQIYCWAITTNYETLTRAELMGSVKRAEILTVTTKSDLQTMLQWRERYEHSLCVYTKGTT